MYFQEKPSTFVELSFSFPKLWIENLKGGAEHTSLPPPLLQGGQDRVKVATYQTKCVKDTFLFHVTHLENHRIYVSKSKYS